MGMRVVLVHTKGPVLNMDGSSLAHAFGPFESYEAAVAFDDAVPDDCHKTVLDIVGPDPEDIARAEQVAQEAPSDVKRVN